MLNKRSLINKFSDLEALTTSEEFHIIRVSKSWINTDNKDFLAQYFLPSYSMFSCERRNKYKVEVFCST